MTKALFLDRDGVINKDLGYVGTVERFIFNDSIVDLLRYFSDQGYLIFVVTNQSGIARGYYTEQQMLLLHKHMTYKFLQQGIIITDIKYCPHLPSCNCGCRKPAPGMIKELIDKYNLCANKSIMVGDKRSDIEAGLNAGLKRNVLISQYEPFSSDIVLRFNNLTEYLTFLVSGKNM